MQSCMSSQHDKNGPLRTLIMINININIILFFGTPHSHHLQIAQLMSLWVDLHIGLMFILVLIVDE